MEGQTFLLYQTAHLFCYSKFHKSRGKMKKYLCRESRQLTLTFNIPIRFYIFIRNRSDLCFELRFAPLFGFFELPATITVSGSGFSDTGMAVCRFPDISCYDADGSYLQVKLDSLYRFTHCVETPVQCTDL
jgi:hypothetical protein